jgi:hypothetical protein
MMATAVRVVVEARTARMKKIDDSGDAGALDDEQPVTRHAKGDSSGVIGRTPRTWS